MHDKINGSKVGDTLLGISKAAETGSAIIIGGVSLVWRAFTSVFKFGVLFAIAIMALRFMIWMMAQ